ncbi:MAG: 4-hydroxy-tetrahydrodipicolinate reductase [Bacteroidetes bacterium]|nr:4-hydroxy-tetrahydrodipicolinate reductase [Bacteroidota bacterium]
MRIALIGFGRMGKEIHRIALERGHTINLTIDLENSKDINKISSENTDVAIEFSLPTEAKSNIKICLENGIPCISGTTGWATEIEEINALSNTLKVGFLYASNFSLGMNIFFELNQFMAKIMNHVGEYNIDISETHHTKKLDKPSGTAITLADQILHNVERKNYWQLDQSSNNSIKIESIREGEIPGIHHVNYTSESDSITISHAAKSRKGFALGAVVAAEFMARKKEVYSMKDVLNEILGKTQE